MTFICLLPRGESYRREVGLAYDILCYQSGSAATPERKVEARGKENPEERGSDVVMKGFMIELLTVLVELGIVLLSCKFDDM